MNRYMSCTPVLEEGLVVSARSRLLLRIAAAATLIMIVPATAGAMRFPAPKDGAVLVGIQPLKPAKPLSVSVTVDQNEPSSAIVKLQGGQPPFSIWLVGDSGTRRLYTGKAREVRVPVLAGVTTYRVVERTTDAPTTPLGWSRTAEGGSLEATISGDTKFWVGNTATRMIRKYDAGEDTITANVLIPGDETTTAVTFRNVAVRPTDDHVFVVFSDNLDGATRNRLVELDPAGSRVATIPVAGSYKIQDVTFDANGDIFVSDRGTGYYGSNRVRIVKIDRTTYQPLLATQTVLPPNAYIGYPMVNLTTMLEYQQATNKIVARINSGTFAVLNPATLAIESYRFSGDYCYTCMALSTSDETSVTLYTGGSGFYLPAFFGKQTGFLNDTKYLDPSIITTPSHSWIVTPTLPAILDVAVDSNDFVYTIQHDGPNGITRAYVVDPDGVLVKTVALPDGTRIAVQNPHGGDHNADLTGGVYAASMNTGCFGCHYQDLRKEHGDVVLESLSSTAGAGRTMGMAAGGDYAASSSVDDRCNACHDDKVENDGVGLMAAGRFNESNNATVAAVVNKGARYSSFGKRCDACHYSPTGTDGPRIAHSAVGSVVLSNYRDEFIDWTQGGGHNVGTMVAAGTYPHEGSGASAVLGKGELPATIGGLSTSGWTFQGRFTTGHSATEALTCVSCHSWSGGAGPQGASGVINIDPAYPQGWKTATDATKTSTVCAKCHDFTIARSGSHGQHNAYACTSCHIGVPHGWKRPRLLRNSTDAAPYAVTNPGADYLVGFSASAKKSETQWDSKACADSCGNPSQHNASVTAVWP